MRRFDTEARRRTIAEPRIVDLLVMNGLRFEAANGEREGAERAARAALDQMIAHGLPFRQDAGGGRAFDPVEAWNFIVRDGRDGASRFWVDCCVETGHREVWRHGPGRPSTLRTPPPDLPPPERYRVSLWRRFNLRDRSAGERVRLRLPLPLEDTALRDLSMELQPPGPAEVRRVVTPGRLDIVMAVPDSREASLGWRATFTAVATDDQRAVEPSPEERALYLRPLEGMINISPRIRALAADLAGPSTDPMSMMRRFWSFMMDGLACGAIHYDQLGASDPLGDLLDLGWYDCHAGSALLAALCRARGTPARLVTGYLLHETAPAFHTWLEVWIEGRRWAPFDLMSWGLSRGGRDQAWRDHYFGRIDHRMVMERPPRLFVGAGAARLPPRWVLLTALADRGASATFENADTGDWVYREEVEVERLPPDPQRID